MHQRRKQKPNKPSSKHTTWQYSAQGTSESKSHRQSSAEKRMESHLQLASQHRGHRGQKHTGFRASKHAPAFPCYHCLDSNPDLLERPSLKLELESLSNCGEGDSDTDLSDTERLPVSLSGHVPQQLELKPEVIANQGSPNQRHRPRGQGCAGFGFPDFLPPPFNSWSLRHLAVFYNMEGRAAPQPRPVGSLERYLERLLQLEWHQIQTVYEESGKSTVSDVIHSCRRTPAAASSRLSSPKCILQCQRAFPLTFLSSLLSHSALLSGSACTLSCNRYSTCSTSYCRSTHSHTRHSRISPVLERRGPLSVPKRSYSESRVCSSDWRSASQTQMVSSPVRANSHLRRMQASGNIRNLAQGAITKPQVNAKDSINEGAGDCLGVQGSGLDYKTGEVRKRSGSGQQRSGVETVKNGTEKKRSSSECRRRGSERRREVEFKEIKPDAVTGIMDNLPATRYTAVNRANSQKLFFT
ncbi:hypothetical protein Q5P01_002185 [Channa striata]|uniref:Family with sequence similarity 217, member B n=1 Tax=Channa striata TaxID=64152 RepID=A0AA88T4K9_CHASR|nr:hypothetical protein Q5P01_002185 [Channa striata]